MIQITKSLIQKTSTTLKKIPISAAFIKQHKKIRKWCETLNKAAYKVVYIPLSTLTVLEFYRQLASSLGIEPYHKKVDNFRTIQEIVTRYEKEKRVTLIIILDEANYLKSEILNDLKLLFNFDMDSQGRAIVLLMGLPNLNRTLNLNVHEPLKQRIVMNYQLDSLNKDESKNYILRKLKGAGCHQTVFEEQALEAVATACNGVPRRINQLCNQCLLIGNNQNKNMINIDVFMVELMYHKRRTSVRLLLFLKL